MKVMSLAVAAWLASSGAAVDADHPAEAVTRDYIATFDRGDPAEYRAFLAPTWRADKLADFIAERWAAE